MDTLQMHCNQAVPPLKQKAPDLEFAAELEEIIQQLMAKSPEDRFQNMTQVKDSLLVLENSLKKRQGLTTGGAKVLSRRLVVGLLALLAIVGLGATTLFLSGRSPRPRVTDRPLLPPDKSNNFSDYAEVVSDENLMDSRQKAETIAAEIPVDSTALIKTVVSNQFFRGYDKAGNSLYDLPELKGSNIGKFCILSRERFLDAPFSGKVTLHRGDKWLFRPDPIVGQNPSILLGFRPEDIAGINLDALNPADCANVLKVAVDRFPKLYSVVLRDHQVDARTLGLINSLPSLGMLAINAEGVSSAQLLVLKRLSCLEEFEVANYKGDLSELLDRIYSSQLRALALKNVRIKESDLLNLKRASNLERLALDHVGMKSEWLKDLLALNQLAYLDLLNDGENTSWVEPLKPFGKLKELVIRDDNAGAEERKKLHDLLKSALKIKGRDNNCNVRTNRDTEIGNFGNHNREAADIGVMIKP